MFDVVIIGSGAAGLSTALSIDPKFNVLILTADRLEGANTKLAQGGIAASWHVDDEDKMLHIADTNKAGSFKNDKLAVKQLVYDSEIAIDFLISHGTKFDMVDDQYDLTAEGAHSTRRIFHAQGDSTGQVIFDALLSSVEQSGNITILNQSLVISARQLEVGLYQVGYQQNNQNFVISTNNLVIACGGYGNLFKATTNTKYINGCNLIIAKQLGLSVSNLHYLQFHPTGFKDKFGKYHLLTESLRGEGARFYSPQSGYFMDSYHHLGDIAPRDVASRAVHNEIKNGHHVYLDCRPVAAKTDIHRRFQTVSKAVAISDYDLAIDLIPISPVAHYSIGGIDINLDGECSKPGVYAVGESAMSGVHGANRLASNSLLECVVYGIRIGKQIKSEQRFEIEKINGYQQIEFGELSTIQNILNQYCNIVRTQSELELGYQKLSDIDGGVFVQVAIDIIKSCMDNQSCGCHYKENSE